MLYTAGTLSFSQINSTIFITNGNLGINTTVPGFQLDVAGQINATTYTGANISLSGQVSATTYTGANISVSGTVSSGALYPTSINFGSNYGNQQLLLANQAGGAWAIGAQNFAMQYQVGSATNGSHVFYTSSTTGALGVERMRVTGMGYMGIGTTSPAYTLDVLGNGINANATVGNISYTPAYIFNKNDSFANQAHTALYSPNITQGSTTLQFGQGRSNGNVGQLNFYYGGNNNTSNSISLGYYGGGGANFYMYNNGRVGINNNNPAYTFDVTGTINASTSLNSTNLLITNATMSNLITNNVNLGMSSMFSGSFSASNNVVAASNVTGLAFTNANIQSFTASVAVNILVSSGTSLYALYNLTGQQTSTGWSLYIDNMGDVGGVTFSITSAGQVQYVSTNVSNFTSSTFRYSVTQISASGSYSSLSNTQGGYIVDTIQINNTQDSVPGTSNGALYILGGSTFTKQINILSTANSTAVGTGGSLTVLGGTSISKDLYVGGKIQITGALAKGSGTFDINHPILPNKRLVHSFIEGPRCDLIYRGTAALVGGKATINIDSDCVAESESAMSQGTFEALCVNPVYYLQNHDSFDRVKANVSGNILTITCENVNSVDVIHWMVVAERKDAFIKQWNRTNENGYLVTEYSKE